MKNNNFDVFLMFGLISLILMPLFIPFYLIIKSKRNKKKKILDDIFNEIIKSYEVEEDFLNDFKLNIKKDSIQDLYETYDSLIKKESLLLYLKYKKIEYENTLEELKNLFIIKDKINSHERWEDFKSKNILEEQLLKNINLEKTNIYSEFKRLNNV